MSQLMFLTYRGWIVVPIACAVLTVSTLRTSNATPLQFGVLAGICLSGAFVLTAWFIEAVFRPMNALIGKVDG